MIKKFKGRDYARGFAFLVAVFLLFLSIRPCGEEHPPFMHWPVLQVQRDGAATDSFQFAFLSDNHKGWGVFKPIMKEIARDGYSFAIHGGDFVAQSKEDRYRFFFKELAEVKGKTPIFFVPGNHDVYDKHNKYSLENFHKYCGSDHYWFSWGNTAFVVVNDSRSTITADQFHWLKNALRKLRGDFKHILVFMHVPPFDPRENEAYALPKSDKENFMALMEKYRVAYVFSGHIHCYFKEIINGVTYIVAPPAGGTPRCSPPSYGYIHIAVNGKEIKDSVVTVENKWWLQLKGDMQYELRVRSPFLLPLLTVVMGQSYLYFLAL
jgi:Icc protein